MKTRRCELEVGRPARKSRLNWRRGALFVLLCGLLRSTCVWAQDDVAEAARREQARKAAEQKSPPHVYTDEDLQKSKILTPGDQAKVEARKKLKDSTVPTEDAKSAPQTPAEPTESLGEVARRYRKEQAAREEAEAAKKIAPFPYTVPSPALASPIAKPSPPVLSARPSVPPLLATPSMRMSPSRPARISPFTPRPLLAPTVHPHRVLVNPPTIASPRTVMPPIVTSKPMLAPPVASPSRAVDAAGLTAIQVQRGDSWWKLAERYLGNGARWTELRSLNGRVEESPESLRLGSTVVVPRSEALRSSSTQQRVMIKSGDTLWALAREHFGHGSAWGCLASANPGISNYGRLSVGSVLLLPSPQELESCRASHAPKP